jgi:hypothetical protein
MIDPVSELKVRAELLQRGVTAGEDAALARLTALPELRKADQEALRAAAAAMKRKHCLAVVAIEHGFTGWEHARRVLSGDSVEEADYGKLLSGPQRSAFLNHWFATYDEARAVHLELLARDEGARYLLPYQRQFFITERAYVESLGLDPDDPDWRAIGWDWARPKNRAARGRLYARLLSQTRREAG